MLNERQGPTRRMIWLDLDHTLVWAQPEVEFPRTALRTRKFSVLGQSYVGVAREGVEEFLRALRELGTVRLLTFARRPYAVAVAQVFNLGFESTEIFAQESWWGGFLSGPRKRENPEPNGCDVLVVNGGDATKSEKMEWLGLGARLVELPDFNSEDRFALDWTRYVDDVRRQLG